MVGFLAAVSAALAWAVAAEELCLVQKDVQRFHSSDGLARKQTPADMEIPELDTRMLAAEKQPHRKSHIMRSHDETVDASDMFSQMNDTASSLVQGALESMSTMNKTVAVALKTFEIALGQASSEEHSASVDKLAAAVQKAQSAVASSTSTHTARINSYLEDFATLISKASSGYQVASNSTFNVVKEAQKPEVSAPPVMLLRGCCSAETPGIWDWFNRVFGGGKKGPCPQAKADLSSANSTMDHLGAGFHDMAAKVSESLTAWVTSANKSLDDLAQEMHNAPQKLRSAVRPAFNDFSSTTTEALAQASQVGNQASRSSRKVGTLVDSTRSALGELELQTTAACAQLEKAKKAAEAAGPCSDHHC